MTLGCGEKGRQKKDLSTKSQIRSPHSEERQAGPREEGATSKGLFLM